MVGLFTVITGVGLVEIVTVADEVHPFPSVTLTVYVPPETLLMVFE
jgi:hypothetical protein